jgi:hypothetical protein
VIADTKLFWPERSKGKSYIISGFHQAYIYACDFNEPCAYLVIYKMCGEALNFLVPTTKGWFPSLTVNNKTIFFIVVDIFEHGAPASKRGPMKSVDTTAQEFVQSVEVGSWAGGRCWRSRATLSFRPSRSSSALMDGRIPPFRIELPDHSRGLLVRCRATAHRAESLSPVCQLMMTGLTGARRRPETYQEVIRVKKNMWRVGAPGCQLVIVNPRSSESRRECGSVRH